VFSFISIVLTISNSSKAINRGRHHKSEIGKWQLQNSGQRAKEKAAPKKSGRLL
jgi:hypothetical protein